MSSSRRSSKQQDTGSEFFLECKAAFLAVYDDIGDKIESKKRLNIVLQQSGRNPSKTTLDKYWTRDTEELSFNDFVDICRKEPVTTADDLMKAFRKIDINGDGYISLEELYKIMNAQGEQMTRDDVRKIIDEVDENKDGRLDYSEFTNMIMKTTEESKKFSIKVMEKKERKKKRVEKRSSDENGLGSQLSVRSADVPKPSPRVTKGKGRSSIASKDAMPDPKSLRDWSHSTSKGCFFYEEDEIVTHVYSLKLAEDSMVYLCAYPIQEPACLNLPGTEPVDTALFVFDSRGKLVTCTEERDTKGTYGVKCELSAGQYEILPYTTGCRFRQRGEEGQHNIKESKLVKTKDDKVVITTAFRKALEDIFDLCDLDNNGTMSRDEFNWFNLRTSGEELGEDEWEVVEEKTALENGEITKKGFIELNEMEAEDAAGDVEDLWITLTSMGMNKGLIMDEACPFRVDVYVESARKTPRLKVTGIESIEKKEYRSEICQYIIEKADEPVKIRSMKDLYKYTYKTDLKASIVIDNRSRSSVNLEVDCSKSKNAISNRPELKHTVEINPQDVIIAHHLMPKSELSDWTVTSTEEILK